MDRLNEVGKPKVAKEKMDEKYIGKIKFSGSLVLRFDHRWQERGLLKSFCFSGLSSSGVSYRFI